MAEMYRPELELSYMGGLFDGEGYISIRYQLAHNKYDTFSLMVGVNMVDKEPVELFHNMFGGSLHLRNGGNENQRPCWRWRIESRGAYECVKILKPYLRLKREKACLAISFQENKKTYNYRPLAEKCAEMEYYNKMRLLNRRGIYALQTAKLGET